MNRLAQSKVVDLVLPGQQPPPSNAGMWWAAAAIAVLVALALIGLARWRVRHYDPAEAAFGKLARVAGLKRRERSTLRQAARAAGAAPVALLTSPVARERILERARVA